jgi:predicted secreted Zn-dependent protease
MLPSTSRHEPVGSWRIRAYALSALLAIVVLLAPDVSGAARAHRSETGNGTGAGGTLSSAASASALASELPAAPDPQAAAGLPGVVQVTAATSYYDVEGADIRALLASLRQRGPSDGHGTWAASTSWVFRWTYQPTVDAGCRVRVARVNLDLAYTYPRWDAPNGVAPNVTTAWQGYLSRVELHEHGHRDIAEAAANDLARALEALPGHASCDALAETARATAAELLARHAQAQVAYDRDTGHGATQGAVLGQ